MNNNENLSLFHPCANCAHDRIEHFEGKGVCDLGFCVNHCTDYVPVSSAYEVVASIVFPEPGETYTERFIMNGTGVESVRSRVRLMLADDRYLVAVRSI